MDKRYLSPYGLLLLAGLSMAFSAMFPENAMALPAFARQTGNECRACHFQHFPKLKPFGRIFKANGLSLTAQDNLEGKDLSIPKTLNATFFIHSVAVNDSSSRARLEMPGDAAILIGGRLAEGIGGLAEWGGPLLSTKISFTRPAGNYRVGATAFTTDALGPAYGFEVLNTGVVRNHSPFGQSSKPTLGNNSRLELAGAATGIALFAFDNNWFINGTFYAPDSNEAGLTGMDVGRDMSTYLRAAYTPNIQGWDSGFGAGVIRGTTRATISDTGDADVFGGTGSGGYLGKINTSAMFVDAQVQGQVAGKDLGVYFMYARGDDPTTAAQLAANEVNLFGGPTGGSKPSGWGIDAEYTMLPDKLDLLAALGRHDDGTAGQSAKTSTGVGLYWKIAQNISLQPMVERFSGDQGQVSGKNVTVTSVTLEADF